MTKEYTSGEIKYRLSDLGAQIGNIAIEYITDLEKQIEKMKCCANCRKYYRGETADDKGYLCVHHDFNDKCKLWELEE